MHRSFQLLISMPIFLAGLYAADVQPASTAEVIRRIVAGADNGFSEFKGEQRAEAIWESTIKLPGAVFAVISWAGLDERSRAAIACLMLSNAPYDRARAVFQELHADVKAAFPGWRANEYGEDAVHQHGIQFVPPDVNDRQTKTLMISLAMVPKSSSTCDVVIHFVSPLSPREAALKEKTRF